MLTLICGALVDKVKFMGSELGAAHRASVGGCAVRAGSLLNASPYEQHIGTIIFNSAPVGWWTESTIYFPPVHGGISGFL